MDSHQNEYAAAVAGMQETYGTEKTTPADGDFVSGMTAGRRWRGRVEWSDGRMVTVNVGGAWVRVPVSDITH